MTYETYSKGECPVIWDEKGVTHEETLSYLMKRKFRESLAEVTVSADAIHLTAWLNFLESHDKTYFEATSLDVENFRDDMEADGGSPENINLYLTTVCHAYWHCQEKGLVRDMIGWLDKSKPKQKYQIEVDKPGEKYKGNAPFVIPYKLHVTNRGQQPVPKRNQIVAMAKKIDAVVYSDEATEIQTALAHRDKLMFRWLTEVGVRRMELVSLCVEDIPLDSDEAMPVVTLNKGTKYNKPRNVEISRNLYEETLEYIDLHREDILQAKKDRFGSPSDIKVLFVNGGNSAVRPEMSTGAIYKWVLSLNPDGINEKQRVAPHGLRRYALTRYAMRLWQLELKNPSYNPAKQYVIHQNLLLKLRVQAGHESADTTIKSYVDTGYLLAEGSSGTEDLKLQIQDLEWQTSELKKRLQESIG